MPTSKADRLNKLFERDSLPPPPDPDSSHIADTEIISKMQPAQQPWKVPKVAQTPRKITKSPPRTGRDLEQLTSSDDDDYVRAFKKTPAIKPETNAKAKKTSTSSGYHFNGRPRPNVGSNTGIDDRARGEADEEKDDGVSSVDRDGHPLVGRFCPFTLVTKFCYRYMQDPNDRVSRHFFASGKIWNRTWNIYYIHPPASLFAKAILLVPEIQVQTLLDEINSTFRISIRLPRDPFLLAFYQDGTPAPTLLGTSQSRDAVARMEQEISAPSEGHGDCPSDASPRLERSFERFKEKMERVAAIKKKKSAAVKRGKAKDRLASRVNWCAALKRGQRYLGLRPPDRKAGLPLPDPSLSWDEQQKFERQEKIKHGHILQPLDVEKPAPHPFDRDVVFVSIDVEAYERAQNLITEVGISTLDTADIRSLAPGQGGSNWMECIRSRHFRISNHEHLRNVTYCIGNPEKFLFGYSEFVSMDEIGEVVDSYFEPPYSAHFTHDGKYRPQSHPGVTTFQIGDQLKGISFQAGRSVPGGVPGAQSSTDPVDAQGPTSAEQHLANKAAVSNTIPPPEPLEAAKPYPETSPSRKESTKDTQATKDHRSSHPIAKHRKIIVIGHDLDCDLQHLSALESKVFHKPPAVIYPQALEPEHPLRQHILESLDTANLYQVWKRETNITSLAKVLVGVERMGWELHNGGNDARYTMEAMVGILIRSRVQEDEVSRAASVDGVTGIDNRKQQQQSEEGEGEEKLARTIRGKQEAVEKEERENAAMWSHAMGSYGGRDEEVLSDPSQARNNLTKEENRLDQHLDTAPAADSFAQAQPPTTSPPNPSPQGTGPNAYPWSSSPRATRDGGEPKGFVMPTPKSERVKMKPSTKRREEVERLREEGVIEGPCDWGVEGADGW